MTTEEFSNEFDTILNSYSGTISIELDEYEKSVFLTEAQESILIELYSGRNISNEAFEKTEELRRYLSSLVKTYTTSNKLTGQEGLSIDSVFYNIPQDVWYITYESAQLSGDALGCLDGEVVTVLPTRQDELARTLRNPFKRASKKKVLRLDAGANTVELISKYNISKYLVRYISRPEPIILVDLPTPLSINGVSTKTECKLSSAIHRTILEKAVELALISKTRLASAGK